MSSSTLPVSLVCCGLLGTTADDHGILERAFAEACATQGIVPGTAAYASRAVNGVGESLFESVPNFSEGRDDETDPIVVAVHPFTRQEEDLRCQ